MPNSGHFFTFEGPDKAGKSTQIDRLSQRLQEAGYEVIVTREPGGTELCEDIRKLVMAPREDKPTPETELLLFAASRAQLVRKLIVPALEQGKIVLCDRFADSTVAYQGEARGLPVETITFLNDFCLQTCRPELTFLFDLPVEESLRRLRGMTTGQGTDDRFEQEDRQFREAVRRGFLKVAQREPERVKVIDATLPVDEVTAIILGEISHAVPGIL